MDVAKMVVGISLAAGIAGAVVLKVAPGSVATSAAPLRTGWVTGTVLPVWNSAEVYSRMRRGLDEQGYRLFRFPNGSLSNEYHWNGAGKHDSDGIWHPDTATVEPGFLSHTLHRGTTKNNYGSVFHSRVTDGDDTTSWWSDPWAGPDAWVVLDLGSERALDSVRIVWGNLRPDSVLAGPVENAGWNPFRTLQASFRRLGSKRVTDSVTTIAMDPGATTFLAVRPAGVGSRGVRIAEIRAWAGGEQVTVNTPSQSAQTRVWAMSAHPGSVRSKDWGGSGTPAWTFAMFMDYIGKIPGAQAQFCVNYGTGTPEEAAAWVKHANVDRGLGIRFWQVGNEMDGDWEEGGPVDARQYATKYLAFARAMKAVDPSILVMGPTMSSMDFANAGSGALDTTTWAEEFLRIVGEAEATDKIRYLDGFDFHAYPYYTNGRPAPSSMLNAMRKLKGNLDTLAAMMGRRLVDPGSRIVSLSEFNASVVMMDLTMRPENSTGMAMMLSQLVSRFGGNSMSIVWESYGAGGSNPDGTTGGTYGTLALFVPPRSDAASSIDLAPNAPFWGNWMVSKVWAIDSAKPMPLAVTGGTQLEAYGLADATDTSMIFLNVSATPCTTQIATPSSRGTIYSWGMGQYAWNGTTSEAYAFPNSGPASRPVPASWDGKFLVPGFGMVVVRTNAPSSAPSGSGRVVQFAVNRKVLEFGDTLKISGTILRDPAAVAPSASLADTTLVLTPFDGAWDGPSEAFLATVPTVLLGEGRRWLRIGDRDSIEVVITGKARPTTWIDRFEDQLAASEQPSASKWSQSPAGGPPSRGTMTFPERLGGGRVLRIDADLVQPAALGYTVYEEARLDLDSALVETSLGIQFDWASNAPTGGSFNLQIATDTVINYDDYIMTLPETDSAWKTVRLKWTAFQQQGWGGIATGPLLARQINRLNFRSVGVGKSSFWIDNLVLLRSSGDSVETSVRGTANRGAWRVIRLGDGWVFQVPEGARVTLVGLDGRREATAVSLRGEPVRLRRTGSGVVYAILESQGRRETRMLPSVR
jgi:hypothetical protein